MDSCRISLTLRKDRLYWIRRCSSLPNLPFFLHSDWDSLSRNLHHHGSSVFDTMSVLPSTCLSNDWFFPSQSSFFLDSDSDSLFHNLHHHGSSVFDTMSVLPSMRLSNDWFFPSQSSFFLDSDSDSLSHNLHHYSSSVFDTSTHGCASAFFLPSSIFDSMRFTCYLVQELS